MLDGRTHLEANNKEEFIFLGSTLKRECWMRQYSENLKKKNHLASFPGCFLHLPALCIPRLQNTCIWQEKSKSNILLLNKYHCISCHRFIWKHCINLTYFGHYSCSNFHSSPSYLCYFAQFFKIVLCRRHQNPMKEAVAKPKPEKAQEIHTKSYNHQMAEPIFESRYLQEIL